MRPTIVAVISLLVFPVPAVAQTPNLSGEWQIVLKTLLATYTLTANITQEGKAVSGSVCGDVRCNAISGVLDGPNVEIKTVVELRRNFLPILLTGKVDGDTANGKGDCAGFPCSWTSERIKAAAESKPPENIPTGISGQWRFRIITEEALSYPTFSFTQKGTILTGACRSSFGEARVAGSVRGREVKFAMSVSRWDGDVTINYSGIAEGSSMSGTVQLGEARVGTWTATRQ